ncbi:MAG TPA: hypothetical protein VFS40_12395 [Gemmatimonadales bacterium]|nr:hypothetical protein [Gemmatimonadales bacterium]
MIPGSPAAARGPRPQSPGGAGRLARWAGGLLLGCLTAGPLAAQRATVRLGAQAIPYLTGSDAVPGGGTAADLGVAQPIVSLHAAAPGGRLTALGTFDFEGLAIPDGELTMGAWGEGFVDRRHPHTYVHELMLTGATALGPARLSASVGKGFAPFGTDDPMVRPSFAYPVDHHLSQILERAVAIAAVRAGPLGLEAGLFNGDEPERPTEWPRLARFGDSWSARLSVWPLAGLELQGSRARVKSPEHRPGAGPTQTKWSVSGHWSRAVAGHPVEAQVEWARTHEVAGVLTYDGFLAESAWRGGRHRLHYRFERTERPEEERTLDLFRSLRPHLDDAILATTRWTIHTVGWDVDLTGPAASLRFTPFVEVALGRVTSLAAAGFDPASFYGRSRFWGATVGVRLGLGAPMHHRMGRYGAAAEEAGGRESAAPLHTHHP